MRAKSSDWTDGYNQALSGDPLRFSTRAATSDDSRQNWVAGYQAGEKDLAAVAEAETKVAQNEPEF